MLILFNHKEHKAWHGKTFLGLIQNLKIEGIHFTRRQLEYMTSINHPVKGWSCVRSEGECKSLNKSFMNLRNG